MKTKNVQEARGVQEGGNDGRMMNGLCESGRGKSARWSEEVHVFSLYESDYWRRRRRR